MVEKLILKKFKHPNPYKVLWVQKEHQVLVNQQCLVDFNVGRYHDQVLWDILPMDACHLLLGRPWKFDRRAIHDGWKNTYTFVKDGVKYNLNPLKDRNAWPEKQLSVMFMGMKVFFQQRQEGEISENKGSTMKAMWQWLSGEHEYQKHLQNKESMKDEDGRV